MWPNTVLRSGRVWSNRSFIPCGSNDAATATSTAWLPARLSGSPRPREASQPAAARTSRTFSSAPQVRARATSSGAGPVSRAISRAIAISAFVGRTVIGSLGCRRRRLARVLAIVCMGSKDWRCADFPTRRGPPGSLSIPGASAPNAGPAAARVTGTSMRNRHAFSRAVFPSPFTFPTVEYPNERVPAEPRRWPVFGTELRTLSPFVSPQNDPRSGSVSFACPIPPPDAPQRSPAFRPRQ